ncbi:MAG: DNA polymerase III subunit [Phycisphaerae bacterium]|nr:DNA polymerase III subunit [Phycisphaerae bacterium]
MSIFEVRHQHRAQQIVQRALAGGRLPHAYLFHGPDGIGKEMLAERLARILLCENPVHPPTPPIEELAGFDGPLLDACGWCQDCILAQARTHPDIHLIYNELHKLHPDPMVRNRKGLGLTVDVIRHFVINAVGTKPLRGRAKVFIIRQADRITAGAQNALLKTLEEPPGTTYLILLVTNLDRLLPTTRSRCQAVPFGPLPIEFVTATLQEVVPDITPELAGLYAAIAQGSLGTAQRYCQDSLDAYNAKIIDTLGRLGSASVPPIAKQWLKDAETLGAQFRNRDKGISDTEALRRGLKTLFCLAATWFGDVLRVSVGAQQSLTNTAQARQMTGAGVGARQAASAIKAVVDAERHLERNVSTQLVVEGLLIRLARLVPVAPNPDNS